MQVGEGHVLDQNVDFDGGNGNTVLDPGELIYSSNPEETPTAIDWQNMYYASTTADQVNTFSQQATIQNGPYDKKVIRVVPVKLTSHDVAEKFMVTPYNMPWVKNPVAYMQDGKINVVYDPINKPMVSSNDDAHLIYIRKPAPFATVTVDTETQEVNGEEQQVEVVRKTADFSDNTQFELLDSMAEELINLAIMMQLENVESARLNTKVNMRGLES